MIVSFDPAITGGAYSQANTEAYYVNFLRCVTAIATANAGTTSLTVNPYTTTSAVDGTKNCILSIIANTEAGGWLTSNTTHNIPTYPTAFTAMASLGSYASMYKADFYNSSGKANMPYNKMTFHAVGHNTTGNDNRWNGRMSVAPLTNWTSSGGQIQMTFGCDTTINGSADYVPTWSGVSPNQQTRSWTNNGYWSNTSGASTADNTTSSYPGNASGFNLRSASSVTYTMAVTKDYCIIWENVRSHSYSAGYSTGYSLFNSSHLGYGSIMYGGFRTTQPWEDALSHNPPWVAWTLHHIQPANTQYGIDKIWTDYNNVSAQSWNHPNNNPPASFTGPAISGTWNPQTPGAPNCVAAYMATVSDLGEISASSTRYVNYPIFQYHRNNLFQFLCPISSTGLTNAAGKSDAWMPVVSSSWGGQNEWDLATPVFYHRQKKSSVFPSPAGVGTGTTTHNPNLPTIDPDTGTFVPGAYPINISRTKTGSWNNGGICKGIYKSLTLPIATMKLYFSDGQTFNVNGETYIPIVFNEDMYLIRKA